MNLRTPVVAMLWEQWRLTRVEMAQRLTLGLVGGGAALALFHNGTAAFWILYVLNAMFWLSIAKLNGGKLLDGYKPGFPLYLLYPRPVSTGAIVGVSMAYDAISCTAVYLVCAAILQAIFGQSLPMFSMVLYFVASHCAYTCIQWATRNRVFQWIGSAAVSLPLFFMVYRKAGQPLHIEFSLLENAVLMVIGLASFGLTVAGVMRQRCGGSVGDAPARKAVSGTYPDWLISVFRFPCPVSSATRAQVWFELKSGGLPVLSIGVLTAVLTCILFAIGIVFEPVRHFAVFSVFFAAPAVVLFLGGNAFGIRRRQGRSYVSTFEATQPAGTGRLVATKVLVRGACLLLAATVVVASAWASSSLVSAWGPWMLDGHDAAANLLSTRRELGGLFNGMGLAPVAWAIAAPILIVTMVASFASFVALRGRYPRPMLVAGLLLVLVGISLVALAVAALSEIVPQVWLTTALSALTWMATIGSLLVILYLARTCFVERLVSVRYAFGAITMAVAFAVAWLAILHGSGSDTLMAEMPVTKVVATLSPIFLPLLVAFLGPWSLGRFRHIG